MILTRETNPWKTFIRQAHPFLSDFFFTEVTFSEKKLDVYASLASAIFFSQLFFYRNIRISFVSFKEMNGQLEFKILLLYGQNKLLS